MSNEEETNFDPFEEVETHDEEDTTVETEDEEEDTTDEGETVEEDESTDETEEDTTDKAKVASEEKMIPESRLKAALKDMQQKLDNALQENAKYKTTEVPDRDQDPEGYEQHLRLEMSKTLMMQFKEDYVEVIKHYQEMAKINPQLNEMVARHEFPAKFAYDLSKRDMEIRELTEARKSDEWKEFQEFKKNKGKKQTSVADSLAEGPTSKAVKLPKNLNRATASSPRTNSQNEDDYLFGDSVL